MFKVQMVKIITGALLFKHFDCNSARNGPNSIDEFISVINSSYLYYTQGTLIDQFVSSVLLVFVFFILRKVDTRPLKPTSGLMSYCLQFENRSYASGLLIQTDLYLSAEFIQYKLQWGL